MSREITTHEQKFWNRTNETFYSQRLILLKKMSIWIKYVESKKCTIINNLKQYWYQRANKRAIINELKQTNVIQQITIDKITNEMKKKNFKQFILSLFTLYCETNACTNAKFFNQ